MPKSTITAEQFRRYEKVRQSGETNMFDLPVVTVLACLTREQCVEIMENYETLAEEFLV